MVPHPFAMVAILLLFSFSAAAQMNCRFVLRGRVLDAQTRTGLPGATVLIRDTGKGTVSAVDGSFEIHGLCPGSCNITCSFVSYATDTLVLQLSQNTTVDFFLRPDSIRVQEVTVTGERLAEKALVGQMTSEIKGEQLLATRGSTLGEALTSVSGVYALQTGPSIFKPVIHGLHSNRVLLLNNGVRLEGQQWGSEHAPEIDPFVATRLTVIKGASSIRYGSDAIGGVISVDPAPLPEKGGVKGEVNIVTATNNRLGVFSAIAEGTAGKNPKSLSWRVQGTVRRAGNAATPHYYIENTSFQEINFSAALNYKRKNYGVESYYSRFSTKLGIFTGSDASSIADIQQDISQARPTTPSYFSYMIARPYQQVTHQLIKAMAFYDFSIKGRLSVTFARQQNDRSEYDFTPLTGRDNPDLYLKLTTHTLDAVYRFRPAGHYSFETGFNGITQGNVRMYQMLIPNFRNYGGGLFYLGRWSGNRLILEGGARYDYRWLRSYLLDNTTAQKIEPTKTWQNVSGSFGSEYDISPNLAWSAGISSAWRAPTVSELESNGVHQSAGDYEIGNPDLKLERAYNFSTSLAFGKGKVSAELGVYNNIIDGYIYLKPDNTFIHTVRGSKPEFTYTQVNARFRGADFQLTFRATPRLSVTTKESLLYAWNATIHNFLQLVPANRFENSVRYDLGNPGMFRNFFISLSDVYTAKQNRVPPNSDFAPPPKAYMLINSTIGFSFLVARHTASFSITGSNILNLAYRDYMDRFRYYTDAPGRNITARLRIPFGS